MKSSDLVGHLKDVKPHGTPNMVDTELYEMIRPEVYGSPFSFNMMKLKPGGIVKEQAHADQHGCFVRAGTCQILLGAEWFSVEEGGFVYIPPNLSHSFKNLGSVDTDVLIIKL